MSYTTRARVESLMARVRKTVTHLSDSTTVTADEADDWIEAYSAEVDVALSSQGYGGVRELKASAEPKTRL